jgi:putative ABC transport system ATP-binding protein
MLLTFENVTKTYRGKGRRVCALDDVSFTLEPGRFIAVRGPSGCGKSTLLLAAGALMRPDGGRVTIDGQDPYALTPEARAAFRAAKVGFVFQQFHLVPYLNVLDNVLTASLGLANGSAASARQRAQELLEQFGMSGRATHVPAELSTGERQRAALARALLNGPTLLLADEPTGNLDPGNADLVLQCLFDFAAAGGGVLLVTHDARAAEHAHAVIDMADGRIQPPTLAEAAAS